MTARIDAADTSPDIAPPACVIDLEAARRNSATMTAYLQFLGAELDADVRLTPHGKTTMIPELFDLQLADGAWGITVATVPQLRAAHAGGVERILLANQVIGYRDIAAINEALRAGPGLRLTALVDSAEGVRRLAAPEQSIRAEGRPIDVMIEVGYPGGRCGVRDTASGVQLARMIRATEGRLRLVGIECYEGLWQTVGDADDALEGADSVLAGLVDLAVACDREDCFDGLDEIVLSAGGRSFYDRAVRVLASARLSRPVVVQIRSGCYLLHDRGLYERSLERLRSRDSTARSSDLAFEPALEVRALVLSTPEPGRAIVGAGRRAFGEDAGAPVVSRRIRCGRTADDLSGVARVVAVNDQHVAIEYADGVELAVGDVVGLVPSHPCSTLDRWRSVHLLDDDGRTSRVVPTYFDELP